eukprot:12425838-Karenia_brevis.AAC.1
MLKDLISHSLLVGLEIHAGKTKILTNCSSVRRTSLQVLGHNLQILGPTGSVDYLGRKLCMGCPHDVELDSRLEKAWRKFFALKSELCGKYYLLSARLKLFQATVGSCFLYGSGTWTLTAAREAKIRSAQRRMLRWMLGARRRLVLQANSEEEKTSSEEEPEPEEEGGEGDMELETWLAWLRRATHTAEEHLQRCGLDDWVTAVRRKKWRWAGHVARRSDGRWASRLVGWAPSNGYRRPGHPCKRWADDLRVCCRWASVGSWLDVAQDRDAWNALEETFVSQPWYQ